MKTPPSDSKPKRVTLTRTRLHVWLDAIGAHVAQTEPETTSQPQPQKEEIPCTK